MYWNNLPREMVESVFLEELRILAVVELRVWWAGDDGLTAGLDLQVFSNFYNSMIL